MNEGGIKPDHVTGKIVFKGAKFTYENRPEIPVLQGLDLVCEPNETVALVGQSGCGKSTTIQLVERFYDPTDGSVELDGVPVNAGFIKVFAFARVEINLNPTQATQRPMAPPPNGFCSARARFVQPFNQRQYFIRY